MAQDSFGGECSDERLSGSGVPILVRANEEFSEVEAAVELSGGELALIDGGPAPGPMTLAELYARIGGEPARTEATTEATGFGFARVLSTR